MIRLAIRFLWSIGFAFAAIGIGAQVHAAVHDLAAEFDQTMTDNPDGNWSYGYVASGGGGSTSNDQFIITGANSGFVVYDEVQGAGGGGGTGWTKGFGFPFSGVWRVPETENSVAEYLTGGLTDWPTAEGDDPNYPNGIIGGHGPTLSPNTGYGWYGIRYTADVSGAHDIEVKSWQTGTYPVTVEVGGGDPLFGGNVRPHQMMITKGSGAGQNILVRAPQVTRHGYYNDTGTVAHTNDTTDPPGEPRRFASEQDEINAAIRSSIHPNLYRVTNLNLNAGETVVLSLAAYFGENQTGFNGLNAVVRTGADRVATSRWDLSDDWSVHGTTASAIGPDATWSYGILKNGSFAAYDRLVSGRGENAGTPEREANGYGTSAMGWFVAGAADPETGPLLPGMIKEYSGFNFTKPVVDNVRQINGDWNAGDVALHTPPAAVDAARTSVIRWTAPRAMNVDADGGMWRLTLPDATDRKHQYQLLKNGAQLASGTIDELAFGPAGENSANPESFSLNNIAVVQGDVLELRISPLSGGGALSADFDDSGSVNAGDLTIFRNSFGPGSGADSDGDGDSDGADFLDFQRQLGSSGGGANATESFIGVDFTVTQSGSSVAAPEPSSMAAWLGVFMAGTYLRRRASCPLS